MEACDGPWAGTVLYPRFSAFHSRKPYAEKPLPRCSARREGDLSVGWFLGFEGTGITRLKLHQKPLIFSGS